MNVRMFSATVSAAVLLLLGTACGPDENSSTDQGKASTTSAAPSDTPQGDNTASTADENESTANTDGRSRTYPENYVCERVTATEAKNALGVADATTEPSAQLKGALCTYTVGEAAGFTIGYMSDATWNKHEKNIGDGPTKYKKQSDGSLVMVGDLGGQCAVRDDNGMMIYMQGRGITTTDTAKENFSKFCSSLRGEFN